MSAGPILKIALRALARNKARSGLTMLGIIIGIASVIAMVSLGQGAQKQVQDQIASMGTNMLIVQAGSQRTGAVRLGSGTATTLTPEDAEAIAKESSAVAYASPGVTAPVNLVAGNRNWATRAEGVGEQYPMIRDHAVAEGEFFAETEVRGAARVAVIGRTVADALFPGMDPIGQSVRVRNLPFRVIGVLAAKGQSAWGRDQDDTVLIPYTTAMKKLLSVTNITSVYVSARSAAETAEAERQITALLAQRHNIRPGQEEDFTVRNLTEAAEAAQATTRVLTALLGSIAGVSLLVGGIGIMNIMLVSVTERTREIGIRMAVGARSKYVRMQFLAESVLLGAAGGLIGIVAGVGLSWGISAAFGWPGLISPLSIVAAVVFSMAVGTFFGYYPARKAAALDPIEALRYE